MHDDLQRTFRLSKDKTADSFLPSSLPVPCLPLESLTAASFVLLTTKQRQKYKKKHGISEGKKGTGREAINHSHKINFIVLLTLLCFRPAAG